MVKRTTYFLSGSALVCAGVALWLWYDAAQGLPLFTKVALTRSKPPAAAPPRLFRPHDLVGRWRGQEDWGTTYLVERRADGTFTQTTNRSRSDAWSPGHGPVIIKMAGKWSLDGTKLQLIYTSTSDAEWISLGKPNTITITAISSDDLSYLADEGNPVHEHRQ